MLEPTYLLHIYVYGLRFCLSDVGAVLGCSSVQRGAVGVCGVLVDSSRCVCEAALGPKLTEANLFNWLQHIHLRSEKNALLKVIITDMKLLYS